MGKPLRKAKNKLKRPAPAPITRGPRTSSEWLKLAYLRFEKCDLREGYDAFLNALEVAKAEKNARAEIEALSGLLRFSGESLDDKKVEYWEAELDATIRKLKVPVPAMVWHCKGAIAGFREEWKSAQRYFHCYLRTLRLEKNAVKSEAERTEFAIGEARALASLVKSLLMRGHVWRARWLAHELLRRAESCKYRGINGILYMVLGNVAERERDFAQALRWYQKAHGSFLEEHHWYFHLYVLYGYARLARWQQNYSQAYWYLDLIERATMDPGFGVLRREVLQERSRLEQNAVDLLIDLERGIVKTRDSGTISFRKQYVLLDILKALLIAHQGDLPAGERGLSKAEIIDQVWSENYRPEAHDNKLYYNINRLRKLLEPDVRKPKYLLNWKEGYRLAPGLRVYLVGNQEEKIGGKHGNQ